MIPFFETVTGFPPYPWQTRVYEALRSGRIPDELTLPTGTGKTSAALLYLLALIDGADLPRRLVYVVDRRAIVDQTAEQIELWVNRLADIPEVTKRIEARSAFPAVEQLIPIGILRGGLVDTGQWRVDPARPAVIVGTVDMIGSRLLFAGYGDGRTRRSLHGGLLGYDTTVILDEAHLSTPMAHLLRSIHGIQQQCWTPRFGVLTMSATPEEGTVTQFSEDLANPAFMRRLSASKRCALHQTSERRKQMVELALGYETGAVLCFIRTVKDAVDLHRDLGRAVGPERVGLLTGTLRGQERALLFDSPQWARFLPGRERVDDESVFMVSTAAGEVGVDIDADHVVMDLAPIDSVIQRLGRTNRAGLVEHCDAHIVYTDSDIKEPTTARDKWRWNDRLNNARRKTLAILSGLDNLSSQALMELDPDARRDASTPGPRIGTLDRSRVDLLAATSVRERDHAIAVFLRGDSDDPEVPEAQVIWRNDIDALVAAGDAESALDMFPPLPAEVLKAPANYVRTELERIAERAGGTCLLRDRIGTLTPHRLDELPKDISYATIYLPAGLGGLALSGMLVGTETHNVEDLADNDERIRFIEGAEAPDWVARGVRLRIPLHGPDAEEERWLVYARRKIGEMTLGSDSDELTRLAARAQTLAEHGELVGAAAGAIARAVGLPAGLVEAVRAAGNRHDTGKSRRVWQRAAGNRGTLMAKSTSGVMRPDLLGGYRHEFGSLADALRADAPNELTLHLIAAHHGHARPGFPNPRQWDPELPDSVSAQLAEDVEKRFASLQATYGPWGLAWLESIVKTADAWVSAGNRMPG